MEKWEYKTVVVNVYQEPTTEHINKWGEKGWELVSVVRGKQDYHRDDREFYFKRKIETK